MKTAKTIELEKALLKTCDAVGKHVAFEVNLHNATHLMMVYGKTNVSNFDDIYPGIADAIAVDNNLEFTFFELKVTKSDFHSKAKLSFIGNKNYYVMPYELYESVKAEIPKHIGVLSPNGTFLFAAKPARRVEMTFDKSYILLSMLTSAHNRTTLNTIAEVFPYLLKRTSDEPQFDKEKHKFARCEDGVIEPLYYEDGTPKNFYRNMDGWQIVTGRNVDGRRMPLIMKITEFLEERE